MKNLPRTFVGTVEVPVHSPGWVGSEPATRNVHLDLTRDQVREFHGGAEIETPRHVIKVWWGTDLWRKIFGE